MSAAAFRLVVARLETEEGAKAAALLAHKAAASKAKQKEFIVEDSVE